MTTATHWTETELARRRAASRRLAWVTGPSQAMPSAPVMQVTPARLHSVPAAAAGSRGLRPTSRAARVSSN